MNNNRNKWCYTTGCVGRDLTYTLVSLFFLTYIQYTNLLNTNQFLVLSVIIVLCRVWDAVNDPMMGTVISNTKSRFGKYRPWVLIGAIVNSVFLILMFTARVEVNDSNINTLGWWNVGILGVSYLLWGMSFTMNDVSFWSILPTLAKEKKERDNLTTMLAVFASVGAFAAGGLVPVLTPGNMIVAYRLISIIFATVFLACQIMVFFCVHDNEKDKFRLDPSEVLFSKEDNITLKDMVKILGRNSQLLVMAVVFLLTSLGGAILNAFGQNFFYFKYGYNGNQMFIFTVMYALGTIISQLSFPFLAGKFKRNQIISVAIALIAIGYVAFFTLANIKMAQSLGFLLLCIFGVLIFVGQGVFYMAQLVMLTNTIEYDEWKTGKRNDAVTFSVRPFMVKLAGAIQYLVVSVTLVACGLYEITQQVGKVEQQISQGANKELSVAIIEQLLGSATSGQMMGLTAAMTLLPVIFYIVSFVIIKKKYIIDETLYETMIKEINERNGVEA